MNEGGGAMAECSGIHFHEAAGCVLAQVDAAAGPSPLTVDDLRAALAAAGFGECLLDEARLAGLAMRCNARESGFSLQVGERRNGDFALFVDADEMHARATLTAARGGNPVCAEEIFVALGAAGVVHGIDEAAIREACAGNADASFVAARGEAPVDGVDTRFEMLVDDSRDRTPRMNEQGLIDFRDLGAIPLVSAGQPLMRRVPPTPGSAGRSVRGGVVPARPGRNEAFASPLLGAAIDPDDPDLLRAQVNGQPVRCGNGVNVEQVLRLRDVDLASGNIHFDGSVHVAGEVMPGMKVHATGDIVVGGTVDGGELDAGGDISVSGGVIAQAVLHAGGSVSVRFAENARICAGAALSVGDMALQCDLLAGNQIAVGTAAPTRGRLSGGTARAAMRIAAPFFGHPSGGVTLLQAGVSPQLEAQYRELMQRIEAQRAEEEKLQKLVQHLGALGDKGAQMLERARASWQHAVQTWAQLLPEKEALERQLARLREATLVAGVGVTGAVDVVLGQRTLRLRQTLEAGTFAERAGQCVFIDAAGVERIL